MDDLQGILAGFTQPEILKMETLFQQLGVQSLNEEFCRRIATSLNRSVTRAGKPGINWEKVQNWFETRQSKLLDKVSSLSGVSKGKELALISEPPLLSIEPDDSNYTTGDHSRSSENIKSLSELTFEAKSWKDDAWYDVASFLTFRVLSTGELEARVRFNGFSNQEDEWVNVNTGVRERSIPLDSSECHKVNIGDLVLCFQERMDQAVYCDAHVAEVHRRLHDLKSCSCVFVVRYDHDNTEEEVELTRLCCRPS